MLVYGARAAELWWRQNAGSLRRLDNLAVLQLPPAASGDLATLAQRNMDLHCTIEDALVWLADGQRNLSIPLLRLQESR